MERFVELGTFQVCGAGHAVDMALLCAELVTAKPDLGSTIKRDATVSRLRLAA